MYITIRIVWKTQALYINTSRRSRLKIIKYIDDTNFFYLNNHRYHIVYSWYINKHFLGSSGKSRMDRAFDPIILKQCKNYIIYSSIFNFSSVMDYRIFLSNDIINVSSNTCPCISRKYKIKKNYIRFVYIVRSCTI